MHPAINRIAARLSAILVLVGVVGAVYLLLIRPRELHWGATAEEIARSLPEDESVAHPAFDATRAITIRGRPEDVWPWLVQMGYGKAGFYGFDLIENPGSGAGIRSARTILPAYQHPRTGDLLPISVAATLVYGSMQQNSYIVWRSRDVPSDGVFIWELVPADAAHTRLISRIRWSYAPGAQGIALGAFTEFADHVAVRKILQGVRDRVEGGTPQSLTAQGFELAAWCLAFAEFLIAIVFVARWRHWVVAWFAALGAGALLLFVLYSDAPIWFCALLPWPYLAPMAWCWMRERSDRGQTSAVAG